MRKEKLIINLTETGILEFIEDAISIQDTNYKIIYQNKAARNILGDRIGEYCYKAYQGVDHVCENCQIAICFKDGEIHTVEQKRITDKGITYTENTASPLRDENGQIIAGIEVVRDITERKRMEEQIIKDKDEMKLHVAERTAELIESNRTLLNEISERQKIEENLQFTEKELVIHLNELKESNIALKFLLKQRDEDKKELENNILANVKHLIMPYIERLKKNKAMSEDLAYLNILESNLNEIISPLSSRLSSNYFGFTPREIQITDLIKDGKQDKDIVEILNISLETAKTHRKNIRKKLGIYGKRTNLRTFLLSI